MEIQAQISQRRTAKTKPPVQHVSILPATANLLMTLLLQADVCPHENEVKDSGGALERSLQRQESYLIWSEAPPCSLLKHAVRF